MATGRRDMATKKDKSFKYDGRSRPATDLYQQNFDRIFKKKKKKYDAGEDVDKILKKIEERNGF